MWLGHDFGEQLFRGVVLLCQLKEATFLGVCVSGDFQSVALGGDVIVFESYEKRTHAEVGWFWW